MILNARKIINLPYAGTLVTTSKYQGAVDKIHTERIKISLIKMCSKSIIWRNKVDSTDRKKVFNSNTNRFTLFSNTTLMSN